MKKAVVAILISATLILSVLLAACGTAADVAPVAPAAQEQTIIAPAPVRALNDQERLSAMQSSIGILIMQGMATPDERLFETIQAIEQAKLSLEQLDGQRAGLALLVVQYGEMGAAPPEYVFDLMEAVDKSRQETLRRIGLSP